MLLSAIVCPFSECLVASKNHTVAVCFSSKRPNYTTRWDATDAATYSDSTMPQKPLTYNRFASYN